jgi:TP901 family phage tail tape measure protein
VDRNLYIRIAAVGGPAASAQIRMVGRTIRETAAASGLATNMVSRDMGRMATKIGNGFRNIPFNTRMAGNALKHYSGLVGDQARYITQRMGQIAAASGLVSPRAGAGLSGLRSGMSQMATSAQIAASSVRPALASMGASAVSAGKQAMTSARGAWQTASLTMRGSMIASRMVVGDQFARMGSAMSRAGVGAKTLGTNLRNLSEENAQQVRSMATGFVVVGAIIGGIFGASFAKAAQFQTQMQNINAVLHLSAAGTKALSQQLIDLSQTLPQAPQKLAEAMYEVAQAGFDAEGGMLVLKAAAKAASAGLTDTVTASHGLIAIINAYGKSTTEANYISDVLFQTVKVGIITFEELSQQIGDFVGFAAAAGISIEDLGIAMSVMTRAGIPAAEAATSMNRVIQAFVKPSMDMKKAMDVTGISIEHFKDGSMTLGQAFAKLQHYTGGNVIVIQKLFHEIRAARGAYAMMADSGKLLTKVTGQFGDKLKITGQTTAALAEQSKAFNYHWQITKNNFSAAAIEIGNKLLPAMTNLVDGIGNLVQFWKSLPGPIKDVILILMGLVGAIAITAGAALMILPRLTSMSAGFVAVGFSAERSALMVKVAGRAMMGVSIVLAAVTAAWMIYSAMTKKAKTDTESLTAAVGETGSLLNDTVTNALTTNMADKGITKALGDLGIQGGLAIDSIEGVDGATKTLAKSIEAAIAGTYALGNSQIGTEKYSKGLESALNGDAGALGGYVKQLELVRSNLQQRMSGGQHPELEAEYNRIESTIKAITYLSQTRADGLKRLKAYNDATKAGTQATTSQTNALKGSATAAATYQAQQGKLSEGQSILNKLMKDASSPSDAYKDATEGLKPLTTLTKVYSDLLTAQQKKLDDSAKAQSKANNAGVKQAGDALTNAAARRRNAISAAAAAGRAVLDGNAKLARAGISATSAAGKAQLAEDTRNAKSALARQRTTNADFKKVATVGFSDYLTALQKSGSKSKVYFDDLATLTSRGFDDVALAVGDGSDESVTLAALFATRTDKQLKKVQASYANLAPSAKQSFRKFQAELDKKQKDFEKLNANIYLLVSKGNTLFVQAVLESSLDPSAQAALINQATKQGQAGIDKMYASLALANQRGGAEFAIDTESSIAIVDDVMKKFKGDTSMYANFDELYAAYKKLPGPVAKTKDDFVFALTSMGTAIKDLPKSVKTVVSADVTGADKLIKLNDQMDRWKAFVDAGAVVKTGKGKHGVVPHGVIQMTTTDLQRDITNSTPGTMPVKDMTVNATKVFLYGPVLSPDKRADGGVTLPKAATIQHATKNLIQWAEPETGGEAFIPLARSKRPRSLSIMSDVADRFGYALVSRQANGGLRYPEQVSPRANGGYTPGYQMGASRGAQSASRGGGGNVSESHTFSQPVYVDKVVAHDYADFRRDLDREISFRSFPGNHGG